MSENNRKRIIQEIENVRGSKVITYITSNRPNIRSDIDATDIIRFREHLEAITGQNKSLDLFLYSYGGELEAAWELVNLLREFNVNFSVLIPYHARSAATLISLGAKEVVMGKMGTLGPIDPTIRLSGGQLNGMETSITDLESYGDFIESIYSIKRPEEKIKTFEKLTSIVSPVLIGRAYRNFLETEDDAQKMLHRHIKSDQNVKKIADIFLKDIHTHNHSISRQEARESGLNVSFASNQLEELLWNLYKEYEKAMQMDIPYIDVPPKNKTGRDIPFTYIESEKITSKKIGLQKFKKLKLPEGSILTTVETNPAIYLPTGITVPVASGSQLIMHSNAIYEKTEDIYWIHE